MTPIRLPILLVLAACLAAACLRPEVTGGGSATAGPDGGTPDGGAPDGGQSRGALDAGAPDSGPATLRVLFIGDSYTYVNNLPGMLEQIAATAGAPPTITTGQVVQGGASLEDQWDGGLAEAAILEGGWTQVVLQGQSEEPLANLGDPQNFFEYAQAFGDLIVDAGAQPTLFVTWAKGPGDPDYGSYDGLTRPAEMQDELTAAYAQVASVWPQSILVCVGEAFERSIAQYPEIALQQDDLSHPTVAGTYLAASTFYVALTGKPVPPQSAVPPGVSAGDATHLRAVAQVGTDCASVQFKGIVQGTFGTDLDGGPFDFGTAGTPITQQFELTNLGGTVVAIGDGLTLAPPFVWTAGGAYPGGSGSADSFNVPFCSSSLAPGDSCALSLTYTATASASGQLTLDLTGDYFPTVTRSLQGSATQRARLIVSQTPGFGACFDGACDGAPILNARPGATDSANLFVTNWGALPAAALQVATPLSPPFAWGQGAFPGGAGSVALGASSYPYCSGSLEVGAVCALAVEFAPLEDGTYAGAIDLGYSDAMGPVAPDASITLEGTSFTLPDTPR